jgi:hypothetical protein
MEDLSKVMSVLPTLVAFVAYGVDIHQYFA